MLAASWGDELVDDEVIAVGELLVDGSARLRFDVSGGDDQFEVVKGQFAARKTEVSANAGFSLGGGEDSWIEQAVFFGKQGAVRRLGMILRSWLKATVYDARQQFN